MTSVAIQVSGISKRYQRGLTATKRPAQWIDCFVFRKGLFCGKIPEFVIGRPGWDNWLLWYARSSGAQLIAASAVIRAIHQNHDYGYHPDGEKAVWEGEEAQENYKLLEGHRKFRTLEDATHVLTKGGLRRNYRHWLVQFKRAAYDTLSPPWFRLLTLTRRCVTDSGFGRRNGQPDGCLCFLQFI